MRAFVLALTVVFLLGCSKRPPNDLRGLLLDREFGTLEVRLQELQDGYSRGELSDLQLRNTYRAFDRMPPDAEKALDDWLTSSPTSYFAHVTRGYHHRSQAFWQRGTGWAKDMSAKQWELVQARLKLAEQDMRASLPLHAKPVLSYYVLLDTAGLPCDRKAIDEYFAQGTAIAPNSNLLYNRRLNYLKPRWCGSEGEMEQFIAQSSATGMPPEGVQQLRAIVEDDLGRTLLDKNLESEAVEHLSRAAALGQPFGWEFRRESLFAVNEFACKLTGLKQYCQQASHERTGT